ncbi:MAG: hypothetical protein ACO3VH_07160 [Ilumatobacteraceae bacterium]
MLDSDDHYDSPHSYVVKNRDGTFDARCYRTAKNPNAMGYIVCETTHRSLAAAIRSAKELHKEFGGTIRLPEGQ